MSLIQPAFDLISDLNLRETDLFDWSGKPTSLHCIVCGNISSDLDVVKRTLTHLADVYKNVIYIDGTLEHPDPLEYPKRIAEIKLFCKKIPRVIYLHNHVVLFDNIAVIGCNGWYGDTTRANSELEKNFIDSFREDDIFYLSTAIDTLQHNPKVEKIIIVTNSVPSKILSFNSDIIDFPDNVGPAVCLLNDVKSKVSGWVFGTEYISIDCVRNDRFYINNPRGNKDPYWPKRIVI